MTVLSALLLTALASATPNAYMPLAVGNRWTYRVTSEGEEETLVNSVTGTRKTGGRQAYVLESKGEKSGTTSSLLYWSDEGLVQAESTAAKFAPSLIELKTPIKPGTRWQWKGTVTIRGATYPATGDCEITGSGKLTVPAGVFEVVVVKKDVAVDVGGTPVRISTTDSYASGVGWIKGVLDSDGRKIVTELKAYELVK